MAKILEVCIDSLASARAAIAGGADRLELCGALSIGGLTPYAELLRQIRRESDIAIRCMIRPRAGDFLYSPEELALMEAQIRQLKDLGTDGFVLGCLDAEGHLDAKAMEPLLRVAEGMPLTLHRCIDVSRDLEKTYLDAKALGFDTVLTSGGEGNCTRGKEQIRRLLELEGPQVLIGAGVNANVIRQFREAFPKAEAFHMSGKTLVQSGMRYRKEGAYDSELFPRTLVEEITLRGAQDYRCFLPPQSDFTAADYGNFSKLKKRDLYSALNLFCKLGLLSRQSEGRAYRYFVQ